MIDQRLKLELGRHATELSALECDGMTRVVSYLLSQAGKAHTVCCGSISVTGVGERTLTMQPHLWVEVGGLTIDYRAQMWFPALPEASVPHGIFSQRAYPWVRYSPSGFTQPVTAQERWVSEGVYDVLVLTGRRDLELEARIKAMMADLDQGKGG